MAQIDGFKMRVLLLCSSIFLTTAAISATSVPKGSKSENQKLYSINDTSPSRQQFNLTESLVIPVPRIIDLLGHLMGTSMQQLDSALSWPDYLPKREDTISMKNASFTPSPLIEYSQSFRTTLQQIIQKLSHTLMTINNNADQMALQVVSAPGFISTLDRYLTHSQNSKLFVNLISMPLKGLNELSENNVLLSNQNYFELETLVNLTKSFSEVVTTVLSAKLKYRNSILKEELFQKENQKRELEEELYSLNKTHEQLSRNATELENEFYSTLKTGVSELESKRKKQKKYTNPSCVEKRLKNWENITVILKIQDCPVKATKQEDSVVRKVRAVKKEWQLSLNHTQKVDEEMTLKRELLHNLSIEISLSEYKKNQLDRDIPLLTNSTDSINQIVTEMEELMFGWKKLANLSSDIEIQASKVRSELLPSNRTSNTNKKPISKEVLQDVNQGLEKIREDMDSVRKMAKAYVNAYSSDLSSLVAQLKQMITISNISPDILIQELMTTCKQVQNKLMGKSPESMELSTERPDLNI